MMFDIGFFSALLGGILTFLAPCTLPLIPAYLGFLAGSGTGLNERERKHVIMVNASLFTLAFSLVFVFFGLASGSIGAFFTLHRAFISRVGGVLVIALGLSMLGAFDLPQFFSGKKLPRELSAGKPFSSFLLGLLFALGWSPCLGPILGTILVLAGGTGTALHGAFLLLVYSLGLALPFLGVAYAYGVSFGYVASLARILPYVNKIGGAFFVFIGVLLILGDFGLLNVWMTTLLSES